MIQKIKTHEVLGQWVEDNCCENEICVTFDEGIPSESYAIIKVDKYYNSLKLAHTPASVDCLIVRECVNGGFGLTIVELKSIEKGSGFNIKNLTEKFETTLYDFIKDKFKEILDVDYIKPVLFFVSKQEIYKRDLGLKMDVLMGIKFQFNGKNLMLTPRMPNPTIKKCYSKK